MQQSPSRVYLTLMQALEVVVVIVAATRHAREVQPRHEGYLAAAQEISLDAQYVYTNCMCLLCGEHSHSASKMLGFPYLAQGQTPWKL